MDAALVGIETNTDREAAHSPDAIAHLAIPFGVVQRQLEAGGHADGLVHMETRAGPGNIGDERSYRYGLASGVGPLDLSLLGRPFAKVDTPVATHHRNYRRRSSGGLGRTSMILQSLAVRSSLSPVKHN
jgi:hypothetical protein